MQEKIKQPAPVVLFVYNRPRHTEQTLNALSKNDLANQSVLYVYADGAKPEATKEQLEKTSQVRELIKSKLWCKEVHITESDVNRGLANSIIKGVTEIVNKYGKAIILEDDIVTSNGFLRYMNEALSLYENEEKVAGISGFMWPFESKSRNNTFFLRQCSCWGWGTWKRVWDNIDFNINSLIDTFDNEKLIRKFNANNSYPFHQMLLDQRAGKVDSWAIRFYASFFLAEQLFMFPRHTMTYNIGTDEGTHYSGGKRTEMEKLNLLQEINIKKAKIVVKKKNEKAYQKYQKQNKKKWEALKTSIKRIIKRIIRLFILHSF